MKRILLTTLALAGGVALALPAVARMDGPSGPRGEAPRDAAAPAGYPDTCDPAERAARSAGVLASARVRLGITEAQKPAWQALEAAAEAAGKRMERPCAERRAGEEALPARLARLEAQAAARAEALRTLRPAVEALYDALTPEQRGTADGLLRAGLDGGPRHHGGRFGEPRAERGPGLGGPAPEDGPGGGRLGMGPGPLERGPVGGPGEDGGPQHGAGAPRPSR